MIEILTLLLLSPRIYQRARSKGHPGGVYVVMLIIGWLVCAVLAAGLTVALLGGTLNLVFLDIVAVGGGLIGARLTFAVVNRLPDRRPTATPVQGPPAQSAVDQPGPNSRSSSA